MNINNKINKKLLIVNFSLPFNGSIFLLNNLKNYLNLLYIKTNFFNNKSNVDDFDDTFFLSDYNKLIYLLRTNNIVIYNNYNLLIKKNRESFEKYFENEVIIYLEYIQSDNLIEYNKNLYNDDIKNMNKIFTYYKILFTSKELKNYYFLYHYNMRINNICGYFESFITGFLQNFRQNKYPIFLYNKDSNKYIHHKIKSKIDNNIEKIRILTYNNNFNTILSEFKKNNIINTDLLNDIDNYKDSNLIVLIQCILLNIINIPHPLLIITNSKINNLLFNYFNNNKNENLENNVLYYFKPNYYQYELIKINC